MLQSSVLDVNTYIIIMKGRLINEKTRMFITLLHLFITLNHLFVNDTIKECVINCLYFIILYLLFICFIVL